MKVLTTMLLDVNLLKKKLSAPFIPTPEGRGFLGAKTVKEHVDRVERALLMKALKATNGNVTRAAKLLQISRKGLQNKMKALDIRVEQK